MASTAHDTKIVDQFTRWAQPFADLAVHANADGMARTLAAAAISLDMQVLDVACGPASLPALPHRSLVTSPELISPPR